MPHYYSEHQEGELHLKKIQAQILGRTYTFWTSSAVFSKDKADAGTLLLADHMELKQGQDVLDMGCGIGILGIVAAGRIGGKIWMSDINRRAVMLAKKNVALNKVKAKISQGNLYEPIEKNDFDVILSNPPQSAGKEICFSLIEGARSHLKEGGNLQLVARHNKGGKTLSEKMKEIFGNVDVIVKQSGYRVYISEKK